MTNLSETPLVSVVVPVYKVEQYIDKCVSSLLSQDYPYMEIILVDDGSPDNCPKICDSYAVKYEQISVIHKPNGGLSSARNAGIEAIKGEYILFLDSDDFLEPYAIKEMVKIALKDCCDAVIPYKYTKEFCDGQRKEARHFSPEMFSSDPKEFALKLLIGMGRAGRTTAVLYKTSTVIDNNVRFPLDRVSEDFFFNLDFMKCAELISIYDKPSLNNLKRIGSISNSFYSNFFETILEIDQKSQEFCDSLKDPRHIEISTGKRETLLFRNVLIFVIQVLVEDGKKYKDKRKRATLFLKHEKMNQALKGKVEVPYFEGRVTRLYFKISLILLKLKMYGAVCALAYIAGKKNTL